jgi:hypothetical protein
MRRLALLLVAVTGCGLDTDPRQVSFGGRELHVEYGDSVCLYRHGDLVRCLGSGRLLAYDFTGDGVDDLALYQDTRDGFRHCFSYLEIWTNDGTPIEQAQSETAKWKDGDWVWIDPAKYPRLHSSVFESFMKAQDAAHDF